MTSDSNEDRPRIFWRTRHIDKFSAGSCDIPASGVVWSCSMTENVAHAQTTDSVLMIRPVRFYPNPETAADNAFQRDTNCDLGALSLVARNEFHTAMQTLRAAGVNVY